MIGRLAGYVASMPMLRIRSYFALIATRHLLIGLVLLGSSSTLSSSDALTYLVDVAPLSWWAGAMLVVSALAAGGALFPREYPMRFVVVLSIVLTVAVSVCLVLALALEPEVTGVLAVLFSVLVGKDFLIVGLKWVDPFEHLNRVRREHGLEAL